MRTRLHQGEEPVDADLGPAGVGDVGEDDPTNIYYLAQYVYQFSISAVTMSEHELGLLLPHTGRMWFNTKLFSEVPRNRELMQRDAWWRVIDASSAVRFLLGWCVSFYRMAQFSRMPKEQVPSLMRLLYFSPPLSDCSRVLIQFWSDVVRDVTNLFAPSARVWRQLQAFAPIREGDPRWQIRLANSQQNVPEVLRFLADRNHCPSVLIQRALDGNPPITSYAQYVAFTEALLEDLPRLRMQRMMAVQHLMGSTAGQRPPQEGNPPVARLSSLFRGSWGPAIPDPRQEMTFWHLHL